jgi:Carboxypeptidase regulatory-like domain
MPVLKLIRGAAVVLATFGIVVPVSAVQAADASQKASRPSSATIAADVSQSTNGVFAGRVVDHAGAVVENANVFIRQGTTEVARCQTDKDGMFSVKNLKPGTYLVSSGATEGCFRVWNEKAAPPAARKNALIVLGNDGARGQYANCDECPPGGWYGFHSIDPTICLLTAGVVTAIVLSAVSLSKSNSLNSNVNSLQTKVNDLETRVTYLESKIPSSP